MKTTLRFLFLVLLSIAVHGQEGQSYFQRFEHGSADWTLRGNGSIDEVDSSRGHAIGVEGNGEDSSAWYHTGYTLRPKQLYRLSFLLRGEGNGGCAIAGPTTNNRDFQAGPEWRQHSFVFRAPDDTRGVELRLGQWHCRGKIWFDDVSLRPEVAVDRSVGPHRLGIGERIEGGVYSFASAFEKEGSNYSPRLHEVRCGFNSHRLVFSPGSSITYHFAFPEHRLASGRIGVNVGYHVGGRCLVEVSVDDHEWRTVGELDRVGSGSFTVPADLLPTEGLFVRYRAETKVSAEGRRMPASAIELLRVEYVEVTRPTDEVGCRGWWPDPLPPLHEPLDLAAGQNQPIWIRVRVPESALPGPHLGYLHIEADGLSEFVPLVVRVFGFSIPQETHLASAFGLDPWVIRRFHRLENDEQLRVVLERYYENFAAHRISPYDPMALDPPRVEVGENTVTIDWSDFDRAAERYLDELGFIGFRLRLLGMGSGTFHSRTPGAIGSHEIGTEGYERLFGEYVGQVEAHLREKGWLEKAYLYWFDEPEPKDYDFVREGMEAVHRHAPGIRRMLTEQPESELFGAVDLWCPVLHHYDPRSCSDRQREGEEVWWYVCTGPKGDYTTLFLDHPAVNMRLWPWLSWKYGVEGLLVWTTTHWTSQCAFPPPARQDPYVDPMAYVHGYSRPAGYIGYWGNGDGRFVYPPEACRSPEGGPVLDGPVDSIRWELLREGIEDYEYFFRLRHLVREAQEAGRQDDADVKRAAELLVIPSGICESRTEFTRDPRPLYEYRRKLAKAIGKLSR